MKICFVLSECSVILYHETAGTYSSLSPSQRGWVLIKSCRRWPSFRLFLEQRSCVLNCILWVQCGGDCVALTNISQGRLPLCFHNLTYSLLYIISRYVGRTLKMKTGLVSEQKKIIKRSVWKHASALWCLTERTRDLNVVDECFHWMRMKFHKWNDALWARLAEWVRTPSSHLTACGQRQWSRVCIWYVPPMTKMSYLSKLQFAVFRIPLG